MNETLLHSVGKLLTDALGTSECDIGLKLPTDPGYDAPGPERENRNGRQLPIQGLNCSNIRSPLPSVMTHQYHGPSSASPPFSAWFSR